MTTEFAFGRSVFRQIRVVQRKPLVAFFKVPTAQNNKYPQAVHSGGG